MSNTFQNIRGLRPGRSVFNLSYEKKMTCDMGQLIPIMCDEVVPGDKFTIGNQVVVRFQPLVAPVMHEINCYVHYFFVPYRILWDQWDDFITGGPNGTLTPVIPTWTPTPSTGNVKGTLWDFLGFPTGISPTGRFPLDFPRRAYNRIYNEFYRDETLITEVAETNETILNRCWEKDYFTSSLPWQQRGTAPSLPISGTSHAIWSGDQTLSNLNAYIQRNGTERLFGATASDGTDVLTMKTTNSSSGALTNQPVYTKPTLPASALNNNIVDLSSATTFNVSDLRLIFQIQKWLERNARGGARYTEFLRSHFGVSPRDDRLQRPEYMGGSKCPVIFSEVLKTATTDATSPQGNMAGHGIAVDTSYCAKYFAQEYGLIMGVMSIMPRSAYQQGIDRQWLRQTKYDFYFPEFANLSEQAIERVELYASAIESENKTLFGFQGRYDEMRVKRNMVVSEMRDTFNYWHLGRVFSSAPLLNQSFVECTPATLKRIFAVQNVPGLIVTCGNLIKAVRPLPVQSEPGLIDHN
nr:MAG: major capsid protein [Microvirus sp.]